MDALLSQDFNLIDEIPKLFRDAVEAGDLRVRADLIKTLAEYLFPKSATTQLLINKSYSEEVQKMSSLQLADELESKAKILRENEQQ